MADYYVDYDGNISKKKKKEKKKQTKSTTDYYVDYNGKVTKKSQSEKVGSDIAPVKETKKKDKQKSGYFQKSAHFDDGYQRWDVAKTAGATVADVGENVAKGGANWAEKLWDGLLTFGTKLNEASMMKAAESEMMYNFVSGKEDNNVIQRYADAQDEAEKEVAEYVAKDIIKEENIDFGVDEYSVLGEKSDALVQSATELVIREGIKAIPYVGVPLAYASTGFSVMGGEAENAFKQGATYDEAVLSGILSAGAEMGTEALFGGIKVGKSASLTDAAVKKVTSKISNKTLGTLAKWGINTVGEGVEEDLSGYLSAVGQKITYLNEKELDEIYTSEDHWDNFVSGAILGGLFEGVNIGVSKSKGIDYVTGLKNSDKQVLDKVYNDAVAQEEKVKGKKLTSKERTEIFDNIVERMDKGDIDINTIEEVLGGEDYKAYKEIADLTDGMTNKFNELGSKQNPTLADQYEYSNLMNRLKESNAKKDSARAKLDETMSPFLKNSRLVESYNERARKGQAFEADLTQYSGKQRVAVERAVKSGVLNNTNKSHALVNTLAQLEADKGIIFDYTSTEKLKELGFALEGKTVNGFASKSTGTVTLNVNSAKSWQSVVGHEIGHILKGVDGFDSLQETLYKYAESKGELESRRAELTELYENMDADIEEELTCDLIGDYLFTDKNFIKHLTGDISTFKKVYEEVKYLCKVATGKQLTEIEQVKQEFDKVWKDFNANGITAQKNTAENSGVNYSLTGVNKDGVEVYETSKDTMDLTWDERKSKYLDVITKEYQGRTARFERNGHIYYAEFDQSSVRKHIYGDDRSSPKGRKALIKAGADGDVFDLVEHSEYRKSKPNTKDHTDADYFDYFVKTVQIDGNVFDLIADVEKNYNVDGGYVYTLALRDNKKIEASPALENSKENSIKNAGNTSDEQSVPQNSNDVKREYSLSADSEGNELSIGVQKRFANSKAVDENGKLKVLYHGTANGEFYTFDKSKGSVEGDFGSGFYFTDNEGDVENNYEGGGADFDNKVARRAKQIEQEEDIDYHEAEQRARKELYVGSHKHTVYLNIENPAIVGETNLFDYDSFAEEYDRNDYESDEDYEADVEYLVQDKIDEILWDIEKNIDIYSTNGIAEVLWNAVNEGGIDIEQLKANINNLYLEDNNGNLVGNEVTRQIIESLGYDGIIDNTVSTKFNMNLEEGTTHYIVFKPNQIKSIDNQNPTDDPDIRKSLSKQGEDIAPVGNYNTPLNETAYAPVAENATTETVADNAMDDDVAPFFTDEDAPPEIETEYYDVPDTTAIDEKTLNNIGKSLRDTLSLTPTETKAIQEIVQEYSTSENPNIDELFDTIKEKFGEKVWKEKNQELAEVKRFLRTSKINVSPKIKSGIADYKDFRKSLGSKLGTSKDGVPVDAKYQELVDLYPEYFSEEIWNETDQFLRMAEVASMDLYTSESYSLDDEVIQEAVNIVANEVRGYKENLTRTAAEDTAKEALDSVAPLRAEQLTNGSRGDALLNQSLDNFPIKTVEDRLKEKIRAVEGELADNKVLRREAMQNYDKQIADLTEQYINLKNKNSKKGNDIVRRITRLESLKASNDANYAKRISDLEARIEKMNTEEYHRALNKQDKMTGYAEWAENLIGDTSTWADKKMGIQYQTNTEHRNLRDIVRDANGNKDIARADAIYEATGGEYNRNHAEYNRTITKVKHPFLKMKINKAENTYIQMLGELRHNPDTTLTEKVVNEYYEQHKDKIDTAKVDKAIELARKTYDTALEQLNAKLREQGMKEIPYRQGYFPHFTEPKQNFIQKLLNWKTQDNEIPTSIAGLTEDFKPVKSYQPFDKQRHGDTTDYNFLKGLDNYLQGAYDWIYHLEDIQKRRAIENYIRYTHSEEGIKAKIKEVYADDTLDADEAQARIEQILEQANNPLNNFVQDFMTKTNILAGKKNSLDRAVEQTTNRKIYSVMTNVQNRMSANMVLANVRSALTNFIPITQSWAQVSPLRSLQATKDTIANAIKDDGLINKSTYLTNRLRTAENLYQTNWDKILDKSGIMFEIVDNFSSQVIWRSKYNQNRANGMSESQAIANADQFAENVMAGRSKGNEPTLFNAKNPLTKAFTMFQLEVNNQYGYLFKDVPTDLKTETEHWKLNLAKGYTTAFVGAYVYNALFEKVAGSGAALDPIGIIEDLLRDLGLFDDDEEKEPSEVFTNLAKNVGEELPLVGNLLGGGRIPISSAVPYSGEGFMGGLEAFAEDSSKTINTALKTKFTDWDEADWSGLKNIGKEMMNPLLNVGLPVGGGQLKKSIQGLKMFNTDEDHPVAGSYTDSGALRFPVEDTLGNRIQAGIFGQYANKNAREYFDNDYAPLKEKQIQEYVDVDLPIADYWKYREGLKGKSTLNEKGNYIGGLDLETWQKNLLINNIADREEKIDMTDYDDFGDFEEFDFAQKNPEKYAFLQSQGVTVKDYENFDEDTKSAYSWAANNPEKFTVSKAITGDVVEYKQYTKALNDIKADKYANGKTVNGSRKAKVVDYLNNLDMDYYGKIILLKSEYPSDDTYNAEIINYLNNRNDLTYDELVTIYTELGFTVKNGYVYWD